MNLLMRMRCASSGTVRYAVALGNRRVCCVVAVVGMKAQSSRATALFATAVAPCAETSRRHRVLTRMEVVPGDCTATTCVAALTLPDVAHLTHGKPGLWRSTWWLLQPMDYDMPIAEPGVRCGRHPSRGLRTPDDIHSRWAAQRPFCGLVRSFAENVTRRIRAPVLVHSWCNEREDLSQMTAKLRKDP